MQQFLEATAIALQAIWNNKLRSLMTVLGNIVAVTSIIAVVSLVQGLNASVKDAIQSEVGADTFAVLMVTPPSASAGGLRLPREMIFVIDNSGSMHGASIDQAKAALKLALERLRPDDTFNVIRFNHTTDSIFPDARPATSQNLGAAIRYVGRLRADGGTEMLSALRQALDGQTHPERLRPVTASARNCPARILARVGAMVANCISSRPEIRSITD